MQERLQNVVTDDRRQTTDVRRQTSDDRRQTTDDRRRGSFLMQPLDRWSMAAKNVNGYELGKSA